MALNLEPVNEVPPKASAKSKYAAILIEFVESGEKQCEVKEDGECVGMSGYLTLTTKVNTPRYRDVVEVHSRKNRVFLKRKDI